MDTPSITADTPGVREFLGAGFERVRLFGELLADQGVTRGLIGPREVPRLWDRHLLNSAAVAQFLPAGGSVVDVGTGAGLPGVVLACLRPDLHVVLLEPMERRVAWLDEIVEELDLTSTEVVRGRAEDVHLASLASAVTARAVAPMDRLARWTLPLLAVGGVLLAMKGSRAAEEVDEAREQITAWGGGSAEVLSAETIPGVTPTVVVRVVKAASPAEPATVARPTGTKRPAKPRPRRRRHGAVEGS